MLAWAVSAAVEVASEVVSPWAAWDEVALRPEGSEVDLPLASEAGSEDEELSVHLAVSADMDTICMVVPVGRLAETSAMTCTPITTARKEVP